MVFVLLEPPRNTYLLKGHLTPEHGLGSSFPLTPIPLSTTKHLSTHRVSSGNSGVMGSLTDPQNKIIYEMHQYLDSDGSGTSATCVNSTIGSSRLQAATAWLKANNKKGVLGEFAGGSNTVCEEAVVDMVKYMVANKDVWTGGL